MRKIFSIIFLLVGITAQAQLKVGRSSNVVTVADSRLFAEKNFRIPVYSDTTAANLDLGLDSCGALIFTRDSNTVWKRICSPKSWKEIGSGVGSQGPQGPQGIQGVPGSPGAAGSNGADGREVELQNSGSFIQWRYVGAGSWNNLVSISAITGPAGATGATGPAGPSDSTTFVTKTHAANNYAALGGSYSNPSWIASLAWSKISGAPSFISSETDPVWLTDKPSYLTSISAAATFSALGHTHTFSSLTSKPTTLSGYGITDAMAASDTGRANTNKVTGWSLNKVRDSLAALIAKKADTTAWIDYSATSTITGWSSYTTKLIQYEYVGKTMRVMVQLEGTGTGTTTSFTLPFNASAWGTQYFILQTQNNTTQSASVAWVAANGSTVTVSNSASTTTSWTNGVLRNVRGQFIINVQ